MIKRYSSSCVKFTINVKKNGTSYPIVFDNWDPNDKRRWIEISDPDIQEQMEKAPDFNVYFWLDGVTEEPIQEKKEEKVQPEAEIQPTSNKLKPHQSKDLFSAKRWLNQVGVPYNKMKNKETMISLAEEHGYELTFETNIK